jgi:hypothetical protein
MRKVGVNNFMSLDRVMQAPRSADAVASGGSDRGGWNMPSLDDLSMRWPVANVTSTGGHLFGRRSDGHFAAHRRNGGEYEQALAGHHVVEGGSLVQV